MAGGACYGILCTLLSVLPVLCGKERTTPNMDICRRLENDPYFDIDLVVGNWRVYRTWNVSLEDKCVDVTLSAATAEIEARYYHDMAEYLETQPVWGAASVHMVMGLSKHEMLLFADQGAAGRFIGVANVMRDGGMTPIRNTVPLLKFFIRVLGRGKFVFMVDCYIGVGSLLGSREVEPTWAEMSKAIKEINLDKGLPSCENEKMPDYYVIF